MPSGQTSLQFVTVGDPGNVADTTGFGAVLCVYRIGKYNVTTAQYIAFLNAVATTGDPYGLYTSNMASDTSQGCGISRSGSPGSYRYSTAKNDNFPVNYVSWGDAARFCNWLQNGQPTGAEGNGTTETGAYTLNGKTNNLTETRKPGAAYFIPTENEWYKAAYYKGGGTNAGYWWYTTRSNAAPINTLPDTGNHANYKDLFGTGNKDYTDPTNRLTSVGCFALSPGPYGTYDMGGDVAQWNESVFPVRGGACVAEIFTAARTTCALPTGTRTPRTTGIAVSVSAWQLSLRLAAKVESRLTQSLRIRRPNRRFSLKRRSEASVR